MSNKKELMAHPIKYWKDSAKNRFGGSFILFLLDLIRLIRFKENNLQTAWNNRTYYCALGKWRGGYRYMSTAVKLAEFYKVSFDVLVNGSTKDE